MSDTPSTSSGIKQFLTEDQIEIERQRRQADWERVRSATDPVGNLFEEILQIFSLLSTLSMIV